MPDAPAPLEGSADLSQPCARCGEKQLRVEWTLTVKPLGTHSLAGAQIKTTASVRATVRCRTEGCGFESRGTISGATINADGTRLTGGQFVADARRQSAWGAARGRR